MNAEFLENVGISRPLQLHGHTFPGLWAFLLPEAFRSLKLPKEREATCMSCPKAAYEGYRPDYRCCTYLPRVPNFMLGFAFASAKNDDFDNLIPYFTPEGLGQTPPQFFRYLADLSYDRFGAKAETLCPFLAPASGLCQIHRFRNSVCSTFFCHKEHGRAGEEFWEAVQELVQHCEAALSQWALEEVGFSIDDYTARVNRLAKSITKLAGKDELWSQQARKELWGSWFGREKELFLAVADKVASHRDVLWEIARDWVIREAEDYDRALLKAVPNSLRDTIDASDLNEGEPFSVDELWQKVEKTHRDLWKLPDLPVKLNARAKLAENPLATKRDLDRAQLPMIARFAGETHYLTAAEGAILESLRQPQFLDWRFLSMPAVANLAEPKEWFARLLRQGLLVKVNSLQKETIHGR